MDRSRPTTPKVTSKSCLSKSSTQKIQVVMWLLSEARRLTTRPLDGFVASSFFLRRKKRDMKLGIAISFALTKTNGPSKHCSRKRLLSGMSAFLRVVAIQALMTLPLPCVTGLQVEEFTEQHYVLLTRSEAPMNLCERSATSNMSRIKWAELPRIASL